MSLEMRSICERFQAVTPAHSEAWIDSFKCTFCGDCAQKGAAPCPNCGGELVRRPCRVSQGGEALGESDR